MYIYIVFFDLEVGVSDKRAVLEDRNTSLTTICQT